MPLDLSIGQGSTPLANQVAGHQNVMSDASGSLIMKPALPREIAFYQLLNSASRSSQLTKLKPFVPQFFGTLRLEGKLDDQGALSQDGIPEEVPESVVLQNLAHLYTHPSILDVKLGTILYAPDAKEEKKARMEKQAKTSTTWETGLRLTGCQTWHTPTSSYILTPKSYGKTITKDELPQGITRFFPLPTDSIPSLVFATSPPPTSTETVSGVPISHLPLPSSELSTLQPTTPGPTDSDGPKEYTGHGIRPKLLLRLLRHINSDLIKLEAILHDLEARFIGSSILVVYEGDPERLEDALERNEAKQAALEVLAQSETESLEDEDDITEDEDESSTSSDDDEDDGVRADARRARRCPPFTLKMIDFAHTSLVEGEGPDEGVLKGISTLKKLIQTRIDQVEAVV